MNTKKIKIYALGNEGNFNYYILDKSQKTMEILSEIFKKILNLSWDFYEEVDNKNENWARKKRLIKNYVDFHERIWNLNNTKSRIDLFYGNKKIFVSVHCPNSLRIKLNKEFFKIFSMPNSKKFKPIEK